MTRRREEYQYWKGIAVGLLLMAMIFTIPIFMFTFGTDWKYMGLLYLLMNYVIGFMAMFYALDKQKGTNGGSDGNN